MEGFKMNMVTTLNALQASTSHRGPNYRAPALRRAHPGINVVDVQPGVVETELSPTGTFKTTDDRKYHGKLISAHTLTGPTTAALPGHFCVWLASSEAQFLKSKFVWANWDVQELMDRAKEIETSHLLTWIIDGVAM